MRRAGLSGQHEPLEACSDVRPSEEAGLEHGDGDDVAKDEASSHQEQEVCGGQHVGASC